MRAFPTVQNLQCLYQNKHEELNWTCIHPSGAFQPADKDTSSLLRVIKYLKVERNYKQPKLRWSKLYISSFYISLANEQMRRNIYFSW